MLWFGTGIHKALDYYYFNNEDAEGMVHTWATWVQEEINRIQEEQGSLCDEQLSELYDSGDLGVAMLQGYQNWAYMADRGSDIGFRKALRTEAEFSVPIPDINSEPFIFQDGNCQDYEVWLGGRFDMLVEDWSGRIWIMDHKTSKNKLNSDILPLDDQLTLYLWAAREILGEPIEGCFYNVLRKKVPSVPEVLKSGKGLSKNKAIDTTYSVYVEAIKDNGFSIADYIEILDLLKNKSDGFFERVKSRRNSH
jgi:hypothetical protein